MRWQLASIVIALASACASRSLSRLFASRHLRAHPLCLRRLFLVPGATEGAPQTAGVPMRPRVYGHPQLRQHAPLRPSALRSVIAALALTAPSSSCSPEPVRAAAVLSPQRTMARSLKTEDAGPALVSRDLQALEQILAAMDAAVPDPTVATTREVTSDHAQLLRQIGALVEAAKATESSGDRERYRDDAIQALSRLGDSYPSIPLLHESVHDRITRAGLEKTELEPITDAVQYAVRLVDWNETDIDWFAFRPNEAYRAGHHFDRPRYPNMPAEIDAHRTAFLAGLDAIRVARTLFIAAFRQGDREAAIARLGEALHALQDLHSHSNWVDLEAADQMKITDLLLSTLPIPGSAIPSRLRITAFFADAQTQGDPDDDPYFYTHDDWSKDNDHKNEEAKALIGTTTKFEMHRRGAEEATRLFVEALRNEVANPSLWQRFGSGAESF